MHLATRVLKCQGFFSDWIVPIRSILAGCVQSVAWSRVYLFDLLEKIHRDFFPSTIHSWVDDLRQRQSGPAITIMNNMAEAATCL
eukprot:3252867-Heterocapsa_arctica.AAC.1